jgi:hypothetical protein
MAEEHERLRVARLLSRRPIDQLGRITLPEDTHQMRKLGIEPDARVTRRFARSMQYAVGKALRRGAKRIPQLLLRFMPEAA